MVQGRMHTATFNDYPCSKWTAQGRTKAEKAHIIKKETGNKIPQVFLVHSVQLCRMYQSTTPNKEHTPCTMLHSPSIYTLFKLTISGPGGQIICQIQFVY